MDNRTPEQFEKLWRQAPTGSAREALRRDPEGELEAQLTEALAGLSNAPVPSNFTARVMQAIDLEDLREARPLRRRWNWHWFLPRLAAATAVLLFIGVGLRQYGAAQQKAEMKRTLSVVASAAARAPSVEALENLEAIQRMGQNAHSADTELLAALQ